MKNCILLFMDGRVKWETGPLTICWVWWVEIFRVRVFQGGIFPEPTLPIDATMTVITLAMIIMITAVWLQNNQSRSLCDWIDNNLITFFTINKFSTRNLKSIWHAAYLSLLFSIARVIKLKESQFVVCLAFLVFFRFFLFSAHLWIT